jgi:hypothetical protein
MRLPRVWLPFVLVLALAGCGSSSPQGGGSPIETARAYVEAINAKDGKTVCELLVESAAYELRIPDWGECPKFVSALIGYAEESDTDTFQRARILDIEEGRRSGELQSVELKVEVHHFEQGNEAKPRQATYDDVVWLVERDGRWRLAKASGLLYVAFDAYTVPDDLFEAPDLAAQERAYEEQTAAERAQEEAEQASFHEPEDEVFDCAGTATAYDDASGDLHVEGGRDLGPEDAERYATADMRRVEVDTEGDDLCVRVTLGGTEIEERLAFDFGIYSPKQNATYLGPQLEIFLEVQAGGRARLVYEDWRKEDEWGREPLVPLTARVGREDETFSFRVARSALPATRDGSELPPWDAFLWGGMTFYRTTIDGAKRTISDDVHDYLAMISHPGGRVFESGARQRGDLPTG